MLTTEQRLTEIETRLTDKFKPTELEVIDESQFHVGHAGAQSGAGHFAIVIKAEELKSVPRVQAHRLIYDALGDLMDSEIHAVKINILK